MLDSYLHLRPIPVSTKRPAAVAYSFIRSFSFGLKFTLLISFSFSCIILQAFRPWISFTWCLIWFNAYMWQSTWLYSHRFFQVNPWISRFYSSFEEIIIEGSQTTRLPMPFLNWFKYYLSSLHRVAISMFLTYQSYRWLTAQLSSPLA